VIALCQALEQRYLQAASSWDAEQRIPDEPIAWLAQQGLLGGVSLPHEELDLLFESLGAVSGSLGSVVNVQHMVMAALARGATRGQQAEWLPALASGERLAAFCLTEEGAGSDLRAIRASVEPEGNGLRLRASKRWITTGSRADTFLVFAKQGEAPTAVLVWSDTPGIAVEPIPDLLGLRSAHLASLEFDCLLPAGALVGRPGFGFSLLAAEGLLQGRLNVARMAAGAMRATLERLALWLGQRQTFGGPLLERGQVQQAITRMGVDLLAARELTRRAGRLLAHKDPSAPEAVIAAKYFATRAQSRHAAVAVRLHGARGCHEPNALARYLRDAAVFEVVEGATEVLETLLGPSFVREFGHARHV
jgi:glutaryl-CoA dehydrogenase (non-decarboxylating)